MGREPVEQRVEVNGAGLHVFEWPGEPPAVLFVHATGFHARVWDRTVAALPGRLAYAVDMRGHGRSDKPGGPYEWSRFGADLVELAARLGLRGAVGVGHSMGGHSLVYAAARDASLFGALLLVDPVIAAPEAYAPGSTVGPRADAAGVARRRNTWASPEEMFERFRDREPFSRWRPEVLRDYCEHGLLPAPDGDGYVLACPPAVEAEVYTYARGTDVRPLLGRVACPVRVLRAGGGDGASEGGSFAQSPTWPGLAAALPRGEDVVLEGATHFIPMESPEQVAAHAAELVEMTR